MSTDAITTAATAAALIPDQSDTIVLYKNGQKFISEPSRMLFLQAESVERVLADVGYHALIRQYFESRGDSIATDDAMATGLDVAGVLSHIHANLIKEGARAKLVSHLLLPEGGTYGPESVKIVTEKCVPLMNTAEVEKVIGNFFSFAKLFKDAIPLYLMGGLGTASSQPETNTAS